MKNQYEHASKILKDRKSEIVMTFLKTPQPDFLKRHTRILDEYFQHCFETSRVGIRMGIDKNPYAIIAQGGYGREEQCIYSDVDLLFLFYKNIPDDAKELIREFIYPLWDIGLDIGYATRTIGDCIRLAGKDFEVLTSLLDARFLCGISNIFTEFSEKLRTRVIAKRSEKIVQWLTESGRERHRQYGDASCLLEPHLKEGQGGLRDFHSIRWLSQVKYHLKSSQDMAYLGIFSHDDYQKLQESAWFLTKVRNCLHHLRGRKYDQLHFEHQPGVADILNYADAQGKKPVESFLSDLQSSMECIRQHHLSVINELGTCKKWFSIRDRFSNSVIRKGLVIKKNMLSFDSPETILSSPMLLISVFEESIRLGLPLNSEARRLIGEFSYLITDALGNSRDMTETFEQILLNMPGDSGVPEDMLISGFLEKFIPEFKQIRNLIEFDEYHLYPADRHLLITVQMIRRFGSASDPTNDSLCRDLYHEIPNKAGLLWAALLHDIGKGNPDAPHAVKGADIAKSVLLKKGYSQEDSETVHFLIREHLLLITTATRRDLHDEDTALMCAKRIQHPDRLKMLFLLTVADLAATGSKAFNDWIYVLLRDLFFKTVHIILKGELATSEAIGIVKKKEADILQWKLSAENAGALLKLMSPRYLLHTPSDKIRKHLDLHQRLGGEDFVWDIEKTEDANVRTVTFCGKDAPGLFSKIAGSFALHSIDILDAQINSWRNNIAVNVFNVRPPPDSIFEAEKWQRAKETVQNAISGKINLTDALKQKMADKRFGKPRTAVRPDQVIVDNVSTGFFTIIEVYANHSPLTVFMITNLLFSFRIDIWNAQIASEADQAVYVFYVRDFDGQKIGSDSFLSSIRHDIGIILKQADMTIFQQTTDDSRRSEYEKNRSHHQTL